MANITTTGTSLNPSHLLLSTGATTADDSEIEYVAPLRYQLNTTSLPLGVVHIDQQYENVAALALEGTNANHPCLLAVNTSNQGTIEAENYGGGPTMRVKKTTLSSAGTGLLVESSNGGDATVVTNTATTGHAMLVSLTSPSSTADAAIITTQGSGSSLTVSNGNLSTLSPALLVAGANTATSQIFTPTIRISDRNPAAGKVLRCTNLDGDAEWAANDPECLTSCWRLDSNDVPSPGPLSLAPNDAPSGPLPFLVKERCNDDATNPGTGWKITPTRSVNGSGAFTGIIYVVVEGALPAGGVGPFWNTGNISLWLYKNGSAYQRIDRRYFNVAQHKFLVAGSFPVPVNGSTDTLDVRMSQDDPLYPFVATTWQARVAYEAGHSTDCSDC